MVTEATTETGVWATVGVCSTAGVALEFGWGDPLTLGAGLEDAPEAVVAAGDVVAEEAGVLTATGVVTAGVGLWDGVRKAGWELWVGISSGRANTTSVSMKKMTAFLPLLWGRGG